MQTEKFLEIIQNSIGSIFTKEDIVKIVTLLNQEPEVKPETETDPENMTFTYSQVQDIFRNLIGQLESAIDNLDHDDVVDMSSAEFSINSNYIELDSIDIKSDNIYTEINQSLDLDQAIDEEVISK